MGRPSLADHRSEQILDAATRCVARYGVDGATLERISAEAGLSRGHVRHYLGNRDELLDRLASRAVGRYVAAMKEVSAGGRPGERGKALVAFLFGPEFGATEDSAAIDALFAVAARDDHVRSTLREHYLTMERTIVQALKSDYPDVGPPQSCTNTAYALLCLAFAHSTLEELSFPATRRQAAVAVALNLLELLRAEPVVAVPSGT